MTERHKFEEFMQNYQDMVYGTALRLLGNVADAEDIAQTVFLKAFDTFSALAVSRTAGGWLKTVTTNLCLNHLTRYRNRWRFFSDLRSEDNESEFIDSVPALDQTDQAVAAADQSRLLEGAVEGLPKNQRVPLVLYHFDDMSYDEIAKRLGVSLAKVKTDIHRARLALRQSMEAIERGKFPSDSGASSTTSALRRRPQE